MSPRSTSPARGARYFAGVLALAWAGLLAGATGPSPADLQQADEPVVEPVAEPAVEPDPWTELAGARPAHWRVIWTQAPETEATISWSTAAATESNRVWLSKDPLAQQPATELDPTSSTLQVEAQRNGRYTHGAADPADLAPAHYHHARVVGLEPGTLYHFVLESDGHFGPRLSFRTAPRGDEPFAFLYGGDSRSGHQDRQRMNRLMASQVAEHPELLFFAHGGDYVFDGRRWQQWRAWLSHDELRTTPGGRVLPIVPVRGNHDAGQLFDEVWDTPGETGANWYHTSFPMGLELLTLNTNVSIAGEQATWLQARLAELRPTARWLLCQYHQPAFPAVKQPGLAKTAWVPLFESHNVDLCFESDGHVFKRTLPIRDDGHDARGVVYLGEGGLGVAQRRPHSNRWYLQPPGTSARGHHVVLLSVGADTLRARTIGYPVDATTGRALPDAELVVLDEFELARRRLPEATPVR